jgi:hypothetical protein
MVLDTIDSIDCLTCLVCCLQVEALESEVDGYRSREQALLERAAQSEASVMEALQSKDALREEIEVERGEYGKRMVRCQWLKDTRQHNQHDHRASQCMHRIGI